MLPVQQPRRAAEGGWQCPSHRVASQPGAVEQLLQLLYSSHPPLTKAALFALANMCILDGDVRDFVRHSSKVWLYMHCSAVPITSCMWTHPKADCMLCSQHNRC